MKKNAFTLFRTFCLGLLLSGCSVSKEISMLQFNIWQEGTMVPQGYEAIVQEIARLQPDFVMLSEVRNYHDTRFCDRIVQSLQEKGLTYYSFYSYDSGLLSRHPITDSATIFPIKDDHGTIYKLRTTLHSHPCAVYTAHLDYQNDTYYEVRGYDGNTWQKMDAPLTDTTEILRRNALSLRDEAIRNFTTDAQKEIAKGSLVFLGGDFNEPSHLDWTEATKDSADHHGVVISWPATSTLQQHGFRDAYRTLYPNPVTHPGYTYPSDNPALAPQKITWTPDADERERIDFIFYHPHKALKLKEAAVVGPKGCIRKGKRAPELSQDPFILPQDQWPSDHKGVWVKFRLDAKKSK